MIPFLLAAVGGYLIGDSMKDQSFADGGETEDDDMGVQFIDYKDKMIMFEPHFKKYYSNDIEFDSLEEVKKYIDSGSKSPAWERAAYRSGIMADGGKTPKKVEEIEEAINYLHYWGKGERIKDEQSEFIRNVVNKYGDKKLKDKYGGIGKNLVVRKDDISSLYYELKGMQDKYSDGGDIKRNHLGVEDRTRPKFPDYLTEVKYDAKSMSKRNRTYVFHDLWNKGVSDNYSWGTDEDLEYMKEKGVDFKVIATYENGEEKK
jgi:hypothetical protein